MRRPECTIDASCLIALDHLDLIPKLALLFARVWIPKAVRDEVSKRKATKNALRSALRNNAFLQRCDQYDKTSVEILATGVNRDRGEAETVQQASQIGAAALIDERKGRRLAEANSVTVHGVLWVLQSLYEQQLTTTTDTVLAIQSLRRRGYRLPKSAVEALLQRAGASGSSD